MCVSLCVCVVEWSLFLLFRLGPLSRVSLWVALPKRHSVHRRDFGTEPGVVFFG